jgi:hypothetical protein
MSRVSLDWSQILLKLIIGNIDNFCYCLIRGIVKKLATYGMDNGFQRKTSTYTKSGPSSHYDGQMKACMISNLKSQNPPYQKLRPLQLQKLAHPHIHVFNKWKMSHQQSQKLEEATELAM